MVWRVNLKVLYHESLKEVSRMTDLSLDVIHLIQTFLKMLLYCYIESHFFLSIHNTSRDENNFFIIYIYSQILIFSYTYKYKVQFWGNFTSHGISPVKWIQLFIWSIRSTPPLCTSQQSLYGRGQSFSLAKPS